MKKRTRVLVITRGFIEGRVEQLLQVQVVCDQNILDEKVEPHIGNNKGFYLRLCRAMFLP